MSLESMTPEELRRVIGNQRLQLTKLIGELLERGARPDDHADALLSAQQVFVAAEGPHGPYLIEALRYWPQSRDGLIPVQLTGFDDDKLTWIEPASIRPHRELEEPDDFSEWP